MRDFKLSHMELMAPSEHAISSTPSKSAYANAL